MMTTLSALLEKAFSTALAPLTERVAALEAKNAQLEKDLLAMRRALSTKALT